MEQSVAQLKGIFPVLPVPFRADGAVDTADFKSVVAFAVDGGAHGVVFPGVASEYAFLSTSERCDLLQMVADVVAGRCPIVAGASGQSPEEITDHCRVAHQVGAAAVMIMARSELGHSADEIATALSKVDTAGLPIILQNAPAPVGSDLGPEDILRVIEAVDTIRLVKEEGFPAGQRIGHILGQAGHRLAGVLGGGGARAIIEELSRGACGAMPAVELVDLHVALYRAWQSGDLPTARALYGASLPLLTMQAVFRTGLTKHVLRLRGVITHGHIRADYPVMDGADQDECEALLGHLTLAGLLPMHDRKAGHG